MARTGLSRGLAAAVDAMGSQGFHRLLLDALSPLLPWSYRYLFVYRRDGPPLVPFAEGIDPALVERYLAGFYRFDPFYRLCLTESPSGVHLLVDHMGGRGGGLRYDDFLVAIDVKDDVVLLMPGPGGTTAALVWDRSGERFPDEAIAELRDAEPLVLALQRAHLRLAAAPAAATGPAPPAPLSFDATVAGFLPGALTPREREIVHLALNGFDNAAIARRLGIADQVVRNRRRGIYDKLDITSERELFRLFLDHVMGDVAAM